MRNQPNFLSYRVSYPNQGKENKNDVYKTERFYRYEDYVQSTTHQRDSHNT